MPGARRLHLLPYSMEHRHACVEEVGVCHVFKTSRTHIGHIKQISDDVVAWDENLRRYIYAGLANSPCSR